MLVTCRRLVRLSYALSRLKFAIFYYLYKVHFPHCGSKLMNPVYDVLFTSHVIGGLYVRILHCRAMNIFCLLHFPASVCVSVFFLSYVTIHAWFFKEQNVISQIKLTSQLCLLHHGFTPNAIFDGKRRHLHSIHRARF